MQNTTSTLPCTPQVIVRAVTAMFAGSDLHAKQIESVAHAILGAMATPSAGVASLGRAASAIRLKHAKHGIKQVDRMLSNDKIDDLDLARAHVAFVVGQRNSIVVTMDWTGVRTTRPEPSRNQLGHTARPGDTAALEDRSKRESQRADVPYRGGATARPASVAAGRGEAGDHLGRVVP